MSLILKTDAVAATIRDDRRMAVPTRRQLQRIADFAIPWGVGALLVLSVMDEQATPTSWLPLVIGVVLAVVQAVALRWRRQRPELVLTVAVAGGLGIQLVAPEVILPVAGLFAIGSLAAARPPRVSLIGLAALEALAATNFATATVEDTVFAMALAVGAWALGEAARSRRATTQEEARRAVAEEQARIARELHDVIAHSVSVIVVQAAAADDVFDAPPRPGPRRAALDRARRARRAGRATAAAERRAARAGGRPRPQPQPGLDRSTSSPSPLRAGGPRRGRAPRGRGRRRFPPASTCPPTGSSRRR